jgi:hypothetical protein
MTCLLFCRISALPGLHLCFIMFVAFQIKRDRLRDWAYINMEHSGGSSRVNLLGKMDAPASSSWFKRWAVAGRERLIEYTRIRWHDDVTWRSKFLTESTSVTSPVTEESAGGTGFSSSLTTRIGQKWVAC